MKFCIMLMCLVLSLSVFASLSNENNPHVHCVGLGSPSADATILLGETGTKSWDVQSVSIINGAAVTASDTDYAEISFKVGSNVVAEIDTRAAHENGLADKGIEALNLSATYAVMPKNSVLTVVYNETDSGSAVALTGAIACVKYIVK